jgi:hypothetical protein
MRVGSSGGSNAVEGRQRKRVAHLVAVLLLIVTAMAAAGCSSGGSSLPSACYDTRKAVRTFVDHTVEASRGAARASQQWNDSDPYRLQGAELTQVIDQYKTPLQDAQLARAKVDADIASIEKVRSKCNEPGMPKACQEEFASYQALIANERSRADAEAAVFASIDKQQQLLLGGDPVGAFLEVTAQNEAVERHNTINDEYENTVKPAYNAALHRCNEAT